MSAAFKLAKKKVSQTDLRRLMQEQKQSRNSEASTSKIDSPFAKYDNGQLNCQLCKSVVRSEAVWKVHVNSKQHKENLALAKQLKEQIDFKNKPKAPALEARVAALKRMRAEQEGPDSKKLRGILKNGSQSREEKIEIDETAETTNGSSTPSGQLPDDFFQKPEKIEKQTKSSEKPAEIKSQDEAIPEGFFDDPMKDAKARNIEYKDPTEEEWEKFQKEIKEAEVLSMNIIAEEQEEATVERQIDEIDAQMKNWSRFVKKIFKIYF